MRRRQDGRTTAERRPMRPLVEPDRSRAPRACRPAARAGENRCASGARRVAPRAGRRGSMMLVVVLGVLVVLALLGFSLNSSVGDMINWSTLFSTTLMMDQAALEIATVVFAAVGRAVGDQAGPVYQALVMGPAAGTLPRVWSEPIALPEAKGVTMTVAGLTLSYAKEADLNPALGWKDPWEKTFRLTLDLTLSGGRSKVRAIRRTYRFVKQGKVQRLALPLLSKFTLYVTSPEPTDETRAGYNCFDNFIDGKRGETSPVMPLAFLHSRERPSGLDLRRKGWVFLGGDQELQLHVTSGNDPECGEFFQFLNIGKPERSPPMFTFTTVPPTPAFTNGVRFLDSAVQAKVSLRGSYFGFYKWDRKEGSDMNFQGVLQRFFGGAEHRTMSSSCLHLLGNFSFPSPTIVVGKVKRVFPYYSGILYEASGEGGSDKFVDVLENPAPLETTAGVIENFWNTVPLTLSFSGAAFGRPFIELPPDEVAAETLFRSQEEYLKFASNLMSEPMNRAFDYFVNDSGKFPPPEKFAQVTGNPVEMTGEAVTITDPTTGQTLFAGDGRALTTDLLLRDRVSLVFETPAEFAAACLRGTVLDLQGQVVLVKGPVSLPRGVTVPTPGVLAARGDIVVQGEVKPCPAGPLTLVAIGGDIVLQTVNEEVWAHLVALDGTVYPATPNPVKIIGGIAVKSLRPLNPKGWPGGGTVTYDDRLDPAGRERSRAYTVQLADYYDDFRMERE